MYRIFFFVCISTIAVSLPTGCRDDSGDSTLGDSDSSGHSTPKSSDPSERGDGGSPPSTSENKYGEVHEGQYHLGPVDFSESAWYNACAPKGGYRDALVDGTGLGNEYLAGVSGTYADNGAVCDSCIQIETETGRSIVARVVTYGATNEPGDIDVSPSVYDTLNTDEYPRTMGWQFAACPDTGPLMYEFQTGANVWWTSFWVRNQKVPVVKVEVKSAKHSDFFELKRGSDGTLTDKSGFGEGEFTLRLTGMDGQVVTDTFASFEPGELIVSSKQFD